jgi:hypothetical protein
MKKFPIAPAPEGLPRRSFLTGLAVTLPIAAAVAVPALAAPGASRSEIDALYAERTALAARSRELCEQYKTAEASTPWWAQAGHEYLRGDGTWTGGIVGWPAIDDDRKPSHSSVMFLKRPSPHTISKDFESDLRFFGETRRPEIRAKYRRRMRELIARLRCQREEERKVGLPELDAQMDAIADRILDLYDRIKNLDVPPADVPQKAAAVLLITSHLDRGRNACLGTSATHTLDTLRPFLTGLISEHAEYAAANPYEPMATMPFWPG